MSSRDRQIQSLQRRLAQERDEHHRVVNAKNEQLRILRDSWELFDTYPALQGFLSWLYKIRDAAGPLRSPTYQTGHSADSMTQPERYADPDRQRLAYVNRDLEHWTDKLSERLGPKGPLVDEEIEDTDPKPRCHNPVCPAKLVPQAFDQEICHECKVAFTEFRPLDAKCWRSECAERLGRSRGHLGRCP